MYRTILQNITKCFFLALCIAGLVSSVKNQVNPFFVGTYANWYLSNRCAVRSVLVKNLIDSPWRSGFAPPTRSDTSDYAVRSLLLTDFIIPRHFSSDWRPGNHSDGAWCYSWYIERCVYVRRGGLFTLISD